MSNKKLKHSLQLGNPSFFKDILFQAIRCFSVYQVPGSYQYCMQYSVRSFSLVICYLIYYQIRLRFLLEFRQLTADNCQQKHALQVIIKVLSLWHMHKPPQTTSTYFKIRLSR